MKIAVVTGDGNTVSQHFGMAPYYMIFTVEEGKITGKERREKAGHHSMADHHAEPAAGERHGFDAGAQSRHAAMAKTITDCQVLIAGGMGWGAFESMKSYKIKVVVTDVNNMEKAVNLYITGNLPNLDNRLH